MTDKRTVELVAYDPFWKKVFSKESEILKNLLRSNLVESHHIGSTAIPAIVAKPTMDILCEVHTLDGIEIFKDEFERAGYTWRGENGIPGRIYLVRYAKDEVNHLTHIHIFEKGNELIDDHLDFRDYLNAEVSIAKEYENLKKTLKENYADNPALYSEAKGEFIETVLKNIR